MTMTASDLSPLIESVLPGLVAVQGTRFGAGAGILWNAAGLVLTNNHVIDPRTQTARVMLADQRSLPADMLARDPEVDLALLQIDPQGTTPARIGDSREARVGELVFALGHPWGQRNTVTMGIISHLTTAQTNGPRKLIPIIRTDARLAPGNSGGPLVNAAGEVLGINAMIVGGDQGIAIPSSVAQEFISSLGRIEQSVPKTEPARQGGWL